MIKQNGVSFVEVLVTLSILSLGTVMLVMLLNHSYQNTLFVKQYQNAYTLAQNKLESIDTLVEVASGKDEVSIDGVNYYRYWTVKSFSRPYPYKSIDIKVSWLDGSNNNQSVALDGVLSEQSAIDSGKILLP